MADTVYPPGATTGQRLVIKEDGSGIVQYAANNQVLLRTDLPGLGVAAIRSSDPVNRPLFIGSVGDAQAEFAIPVKLSAGNFRQSGFEIGRATVTTDFDGFAYVNHVLGITPALVIAQTVAVGGSAAAWDCLTSQYSSGRFRVRCARLDDTVLNNTTLEIYYVAFAGNELA